MTVTQPQRDLPAGLRGGADMWDQPQASVILDEDWFAANTGPKLKHWTGSAWAPKPLKRWDGSAWGNSGVLKRWDGGAWVTV